jgi:hypothetical protein
MKSRKMVLMYIIYTMKRYNILLIPLIIILFGSCITIKPEKSIKRLIDKYPYIISVTECWGYGYDDYNSSDILFYSWVSLDIKMENEKRLFISYIKSSDLKAPFFLNLLGESAFAISYDYRNSIAHEYRDGLKIDFIADNIGVQLNSVDDVIENYDLIYEFTNTFKKLGEIEKILTIDQKNEIDSLLERGLGFYWWRKYVQPITAGDDRWYILNFTQKDDPENYRFYNFKKIEKYTIDRERRYVYSRVSN